MLSVVSIHMLLSNVSADHGVVHALGEDDGYVLTFVHDEIKGQSELVCYNAKTFSSKPVARVKLPQRVPYGFHSNFMDEWQFRSQL